MGRLGTRAEAPEILGVLAETPHARLEGLMTHFASAADYTTCQTDEQLARFDSISGQLRQAGRDVEFRHTSSTNAIGYGRARGWHNMVRAGHALYGYVSPARGEAPRQLLEVRPALTWKAKLLAVKDIPEGAQVGYGGTFRAPRAMRIGILSAGYADGIFHRLSNRGKVIADGQLTPILGTVSMDSDHHRPEPHDRAGRGRRGDAAGVGRRGEAGRATDCARGGDHLVQHPVEHQRAGAAGVRVASVPARVRRPSRTAFSISFKP